MRSRKLPVELTPAMIDAASKVDVGVLEHIDGQMLMTERKIKMKMSPVRLGHLQLQRILDAFVAAAPPEKDMTDEH